MFTHAWLFSIWERLTTLGLDLAKARVFRKPTFVTQSFSPHHFPFRWSWLSVFLARIFPATANGCIFIPCMYSAPCSLLKKKERKKQCPGHRTEWVCLAALSTDTPAALLLPFQQSSGFTMMNYWMQLAVTTVTTDVTKSTGTETILKPIFLLRLLLGFNGVQSISCSKFLKCTKERCCLFSPSLGVLGSSLLLYGLAAI